MTDTKLRELDIEVARALGCRPFFHSEVPYPYWECRCKDKAHVGHSREESLYSEVASYTTDPAAAMLVLEKCGNRLMERREPSMYIWQTSSFEWCISTDGGRYADAATLPLAVCLFARKLFAEKDSQ